MRGGGGRTRARLAVDDGVFGILDENLMLIILEKLQDSIDRRSWCLVCKRFLHLEAQTRKSVKLLRIEVLEEVLRRYKEVDELDLSVCLKVNDDVLNGVGTLAGPRLRSISLAKITHFSDAGLVQLLQNCPSLKQLDLSHCSEIGDSGIAAVAELRNLESLTMANCRNVTDAGLGTIAEGCRALRHLSLRWCVGVTDNGISLLAANCRQLESLDLSFTEVTAQGMKSLTVLKSLKDLILMSCDSVDDAFLECLKNCSTTLRMLDVARCQNVSGRGIKALARGSLQQLTLSYCLPITSGLLASLEEFSCLQVIRLDGCEVAGTGLAFIGRGCKSLKRFSASKCRGVTDEGIQALVEGCGDLYELDLTCCRELTDVAVASIAKSCRKLSSLKMEACGLVTCKSLALLGNGCKSLEEVDFTDCCIDDEGLNWLAKCTALRVLKLGICPNVTDVGIASIAASCCNLREIDLYRSLKIGDSSAAAIASGCPRLRVLNLSYCKRITDEGLSCISQLKDLAELAVRACFCVTSMGLAYVADGCKRLVDLDIKNCIAIDDSGMLAIAKGCQNLRQVNLSGCQITDVGLQAIAGLSCVQNLKLLHLDKVTSHGMETALAKNCSLRKVKLSSPWKSQMTSETRQSSEARGCRFRFMIKTTL